MVAGDLVLPGSKAGINICANMFIDKSFNIFIKRFIVFEFLTTSSTTMY